MSGKGVNIDPRRTFKGLSSSSTNLVSHCQLLGVQWVRMVLLVDDDRTALIDAFHAVGIKVIGDLARETLGDDESHWPDVLLHLSQMYGNIDAVEIGNEEDQTSPSSWKLNQAALNRLLAAFADNWHDETLPLRILGGLVSGLPNYLNGVNLDYVDYIGVHPYGKWADAMQQLLEEYMLYGKPVFVTEYGARLPQLQKERWLQYIKETTTRLIELDIESCWFCLHDYDGFGLLVNDETPNEGYAVFQSIAAAVPTPPGEDMANLSFNQMVTKYGTWPDHKDSDISTQYGPQGQIFERRTTLNTQKWYELVERTSPSGKVTVYVLTGLPASDSLPN